MKTIKIALLSTTVLILSSFLNLNSGGNLKLKGQVTDDITGNGIEGVLVVAKGTAEGTTTNTDGRYELLIPPNASHLIFSHASYTSIEVPIGTRRTIDVLLKRHNQLSENHDILMEEEMAPTMPSTQGGVMNKVRVSPGSGAYSRKHSSTFNYDMATGHNTEEYDVIRENGFQKPLDHPLSTFSIDVDGASYSNLRRVLNNGGQPSPDMVRIEEMVNYFTYDYEDPDSEHPFSITTEISSAPWNKDHRLVHIGLQGKDLEYEKLGPSNLVFLIDVSGSMSATNKLPLLKSSMKLLVNQLSEQDRVAIVAYAGAAGLVLPSTPANEKSAIINAFDRLNAGGSTAGGAGIELAYKIALENYLEEGNNRVILATDGDFNVGTSSTSSLVRMIEEKRKQGVYLTITGFGMGNYKDGRMEQISNAGNGNYFYIDNFKEAKKVFVKEMRATLFTIAKDVKIQVEFNPNHVQAYRLIGYENRMLKAEDFNDDKKDAGELGAGHTVTALYEIIPTGIKSSFIKSVDPLKYQDGKKVKSSSSNELLTVKFRYKKPTEDQSRLIVKTLKDKDTVLNQTSTNFRWSAAVAGYGQLLRNSEFKGTITYNQVLTLALGAQGADNEGYRAEFIDLVRSSQMLASK